MTKLWRSWIQRRRRAVEVEAEVNYSLDTGVRPHSHGSDPSQNLMPVEPHQIRFRDMRGANPAPSVDAEGFALHRHRSAVRDFTDPAEIASVYMAEMAQFLCGLSGGSQVFMLDQYVLRSQQHSKAYEAGVIAENVARLIHVDYTPASVGPAARAAMHQRGDRREPEGRIVAYTLWRSLSPPPQDLPLAICDLRSVEPEDLLPANSYDQSGSPVDEAEFYLLKHHPRHRWGFFSGMRPDELLVFRQHDSGSPGVSGCPHAAFPDPRVRGAAPRLSIEMRGFVLLEESAPAGGQC